MKQKRIAIAAAAAIVLALSGYGLYRLGARQALEHSGHGAAPAPAASVAPTAVDPSTWSAAQGEEATRRHIRDGIRAGSIDPVTGRKVLYYQDPMAPGTRFDAPGKSPFMDMLLLPVYAGSEGTDSGSVSISPRMQQNLGVRTAAVTEGRLGSQVTASGSISWNERDQVVVQARASAFVEKLFVRANLDPVRAGQPLAELYVPDWIAAQEEFLAVRRMQGAELGGLREAAPHAPGRGWRARTASRRRPRRVPAPPPGRARSS